MSRSGAVGWMVVLLFLVPAMARAGQGSRWDVPLASGGGAWSWRLAEVPEADTPRLLPDPIQRRPVEHSLGVRLLVEGLGGVGTGLVGGLAGAALWFGVGSFRVHGSGSLPILPYVLGGAALGFPLGVWVGGDVMSGDGSLLATYGGFAVGALATAGLWALSEHASSPVTGILQGVAIPLPLVGVLLGYELSSHARLKAGGLRMEPGLVLSPEHPAVVLTGRF